MRQICGSSFKFELSLEVVNISICCELAFIIQEQTTLNFMPSKMSSLPFYRTVDGSWSAWSSDGVCSVTCGKGRLTKTRMCDSPLPQYGGKFCAGSDTKTEICQLDAKCPGGYHSFSSMLLEMFFP